MDVGEGLAAIGAVVLIVSLFLEWFGPEQTAWTAFEVVDLLLAAIACATLVALAPPSLWGSRVVPPPPRHRLLLLAVAALVLVAAALINHPPAAVGRSLEAGAWLGLAAAAVMAAGGLLSGRQIVVVVSAPGSSTARGGDPPAGEPAPLAEAPPTEPYAAGSDPGTATRVLPPDEPR